VAKITKCPHNYNHPPLTLLPRMRPPSAAPPSVPSPCRRSPLAVASLSGVWTLGRAPRPTLPFPWTPGMSMLCYHRAPCPRPPLVLRLAPRPQVTPCPTLPPARRLAWPLSGAAAAPDRAGAFWDWRDLRALSFPCRS
jgi:hypothetical protein